MQNVLVTGGAGYIGSHTARLLVESGFRVIVLDNLCSGNAWAVPGSATFVAGDVADSELVKKIIRENGITAVIHFAGHIVVAESVANPQKYYRNNVTGSLNLIEACIDCGVGQFVFSSSAAVYGVPRDCPVDEASVPAPINAYGNTKLMVECMLRDIADSGNGQFRYVALRYFNVAGAHPHGDLGQATPEATHLIKVACETACGKRPAMQLYGRDYDTADGTCIRDYIHVCDLACAHLDALRYLAAGGQSDVFNCGYGQGYSVQEVIECVKSVSGIDFKVEDAARRPGDPHQLIADSSKIRQIFDWRPKYNDLATICRSALAWEKRSGVVA